MAAVHNAGERWTTVQFARGQHIYKQNESSRDLFIIKSGSVLIYKTEGSTRIELGTAGPGAAIGTIAPIYGGTRSTSGIAIEQTEAIVIPATDFQSILARVPEYFRKVAYILVQRLREVGTKICRSIDGDRLNHVATMVLLICHSSGTYSGDEEVSINQKMLENEIKDLLNIPLSDVSEAIERLRKKGVLKIDNGRVVITGFEQLEKHSRTLFQSVDEVTAT